MNAPLLPKPGATRRAALSERSLKYIMYLQMSIFVVNAIWTVMLLNIPCRVITIRNTTVTTTTTVLDDEAAAQKEIERLFNLTNRPIVTATATATATAEPAASAPTSNVYLDYFDPPLNATTVPSLKLMSWKMDPDCVGAAPRMISTTGPLADADGNWTFSKGTLWLLACTASKEIAAWEPFRLRAGDVGQIYLSLCLSWLAERLDSLTQSDLDKIFYYAAQKADARKDWPVLQNLNLTQDSAVRDMAMSLLASAAASANGAYWHARDGERKARESQTTIETLLYAIQAKESAALPSLSSAKPSTKSSGGGGDDEEEPQSGSGGGD